MSNNFSDPSRGTITVRTAATADVPALLRLAELDCGEVPAEPRLIAELDGRIVAACGIGDGRAIADPFRHTADVVELLAARARNLRRGSDWTMRGRMRRRLSHRPQLSP